MYGMVLCQLVKVHQYARMILNKNVKIKVFLSYTAVILCSPLDVPVNGQISYSTEQHSNLTIDTIATYSCDEGYALVGDNQRVCVDDDQLDTMGQWNGSAPSCEGMLVYSEKWQFSTSFCNMSWS